MVQNLTKQSEEATFATKWPYRHFFRPASKDLPPRNRALVIYFRLFFITAILLYTGLIIYDWIWFSDVSAAIVCLSLESCRFSTQALLKSSATNGTPILKNPLFWWLQLDNLFIVAYAGTFIMGYVIALLQPIPQQRSRMRWLAVIALCTLAVATALVDYVENFLLLASLANIAFLEQAATPLAWSTLLKLWLFFACFAVFVALFAISTHLRSLWKNRPN
jgi:hypothetical protein